MSKFNVSNKGKQQNKVIVSQPPNTVNKAGGLAYKNKTKVDLATKALSWFVNDTFYATEEEYLQEFVALVNKLKDPKFAAKLAIFARDQFNMRSVSHILAVETIIALHKKKKLGEEWVANAIEKVVIRPDDILEILAYWKSRNQKSMAKALQKGLARAFDKFDNYQIRKYAAANKVGGYKLIDAIRILHPRPTDRNKEAIEELVKGERTSASTRQVNMVKATQNVSEKDRKEAMGNVWREAFKEPENIPYGDLLRNIRSILDNAPDQIPNAIELLTNREKIKRSRLFPFRFYRAYKTLDNANGDWDRQILRKVLSALSDALDISCENVPCLENTMVVVDTSGSMSSPVTASRKDLKRYNYLNTQAMKCVEAAALFGAILAKASNADAAAFATRCEYVNYNPKDSVLTIMQNIINTDVCHSTDFNTIFTTANRSYDRIVIFSDMQGWDGWCNPTETYNAYKSRHKADPWIYSVDLLGYGTSMFPNKKGDKVVQLSGYSEKMFDLMDLAESDKKAMIREIEKIEI